MPKEIKTSSEIISNQMKVLHYVGAIHRDKATIPYRSYFIIVTFGYAVYYPLSLLVQLVSAKGIEEIAEGGSLFFTVLTLSLKLYIIVTRMGEINEVFSISDKLKSKIRTPEEAALFQTTLQKCRRTYFYYVCCYLPIPLFGELSTLISSERRLMYPAWFPFAWDGNNFNYWAVNQFQFISLVYQATVQTVNDSIPVVLMILVIGHVEILSERLSKIGKGSQEENTQELVEYIKDHEDLLTLRDKVEDINSIGMCTQISITAIIICISAILLMYFVRDVSQMISMTFYTTGIFIEMYFPCYYGTYFTMGYSELLEATYESEWVEQNPVYKRNMLIFREKFLRVLIFRAGQWIPITLETFVKIMRSTYSLIALLNTMSE